MSFRTYNAVFVTERPFTRQYYAWNGKKERYEVRVLKARLTCNPENLFCERVNLAGGLPALWQHGDWTRPPAVGKVLEMKFVGRKLVGTIEINEGNLNKFAPGGLDALSRGVNSGLSAGMQFLSQKGGKLRKRDGTFDNPDLFRYGPMNIIEMSLTPTPRLADCGIKGEVK